MRPEIFRPRENRETSLSQEQLEEQKRRMDEIFKYLAITHLVRKVVSEHELIDLLSNEKGISQWLIDEGKRIAFFSLKDVPRSRILESIYGPEFYDQKPLINTEETTPT